MALDLGLLIAGAKERGELESRVTNLIAEIRAAGNVVLMSVPSPATPVHGGSVARTCSTHHHIYSPDSQLPVFESE